MTTGEAGADPADTHDIIWQPSADLMRATAMDRFRRFCEARTGERFANYAALHAWSVRDTAAFWDAVWSSPASSATRAHAS